MLDIDGPVRDEEPRLAGASSAGRPISDTRLEYLIEAVDLVATSGYRLPGDYRFDPRTGLWRHRAGPAPRLPPARRPVEWVSRTTGVSLDGHQPVSDPWPSRPR